MRWTLAYGRNAARAAGAEIDRRWEKPCEVNVRIVTTSNRNVEEAVSKGDFREDLFFRLNVMNLRLPALRDRPEDVPIFESAC